MHAISNWECISDEKDWEVTINQEVTSNSIREERKATETFSTKCKRQIGQIIDQKICYLLALVTRIHYLDFKGDILSKLLKYYTELTRTCSITNVCAMLREPTWRSTIGHWVVMCLNPTLRCECHQRINISYHSRMTF